jgi:hypothetical protein
LECRCATIVIYRNVMRLSSTLVAACLCLLARGHAHADPMAETMVYRCAGHGRVSYQDAPCPTDSRSFVVNIAGDPVATPLATPTPAPTPQDARAASGSHALREAVARIRVGMSVRDFEALDPRIRTSRSRSVDANGHKHEWRYVSADCVVHLADDVVVGIFR